MPHGRSVTSSGAPMCTVSGTTRGRARATSSRCGPLLRRQRHHARSLNACSWNPPRCSSTVPIGRPRLSSSCRTMLHRVCTLRASCGLAAVTTTVAGGRTTSGLTHPPRRNSPRRAPRQGQIPDRRTARIRTGRPAMATFATSSASRARRTCGSWSEQQTPTRIQPDVARSALLSESGMACLCRRPIRPGKRTIAGGDRASTAESGGPRPEGLRWWRPRP